MRTCLLIGLVAASLAFPQRAAAQAADADAARLRALFFQRDFESAVIEGGKLVAAGQSRDEIKAWYIINLARVDAAEAVERAKQMVYAAPQNGWAWRPVGRTPCRIHTGGLRIRGERRSFSPGRLRRAPPLG